MAETSDHLGLVQVVGDYLGPSHLGHAGEVGHELLLVGRGSLGHLRLLKSVELEVGELDSDSGGEASAARHRSERFHPVLSLININTKYKAIKFKRDNVEVEREGR
jgi:hypothetical protein